MARKPLIAGNWKMYGRRALLAEVAATARGVTGLADADAALCLPATLLSAAATMPDLGLLRLGGQDCSALSSDGAHTGDISAEMLADSGATFCIVGHSERRADHWETDALVMKKAQAVFAAGLVPIVCVGETLAERDDGKAETVVAMQLDGSIPADASGHLVVAYEPVWAIGTGRVPAMVDIEAMHALIRRRLEARFGSEAATMRVLYGGSVKPSNAAEIFGAPGVDGALVGGASLKAADFLAIVTAHPAVAGR